MVLLRFSSSLLIFAFCCVVRINCQFEEYFKWKQIPFASTDNDGVSFPESDPNQGQTISGSYDYIPYNNIPMGATHYRDRIFVTVPRRRPGIPSTLNVISTKATRGSSPSYKPFPNAETNRLQSNLQADPNRIISVYRTRADDCNRLWWIDTGVLEYPNNTQQIQRPSIWVYDLERDTILHRFEIPTSIVEMGQGMASITVDVVNPSDCQNSYGYIPDLAAYRLHVYSLAQNRMWSFNHNYFHFDPLRGDFNVAGLRYQWNDGIFSITLGNRQSNGYRTAYFHPMAGISEFAVSTQVLRNEENASRQPPQLNFQFLGYRGTYAQSAMHVFDPNSGVIFYSQVHRNGIACWNTNTEHSAKNFHLLISDNQTMIYPGDTNIDKDGNLWFYTNSMPRFLYGQLNPNEYNFRLWRAPIQEILRKSPCGSPGGNGLQGGSNNFQGGNQGFQGGNQGFQGGNQGFQGGNQGFQGGNQGFQGGGGNSFQGGITDLQGANSRFQDDDFQGYP